MALLFQSDFINNLRTTNLCFYVLEQWYHIAGVESFVLDGLSIAFEV